ncbi:MAG: hypothetical protein HC774_04130 [Sphingomonadales bacterium]|nr:hypothetical protein [Sphingomonadales bacterium]
MRRVAITGMGVVSSIGANVAEVARALKEAKSGVTFAPEFAELGFRCQVYARPSVDPEIALDRRTRRFMGEGAAWNFIAMQEAIADAGLKPEQIDGFAAATMLPTSGAHQSIDGVSTVSSAWLARHLGVDLDTAIARGIAAQKEVRS